MLDFNLDAMLFTIPADKHEKTDLMRILKEHPEVQFVSMAGLDMVGNDTDERIPIRLFLEDMDDMLKHGVQTDGSSVNLPKIAELNNAKVDMIPDLAVNWYVDYNFDNIDRMTGLPVGTLRIPAFLVHNDKNEVGSRVILRDAIDKFKVELSRLLREHPYVFTYMDGIENADEIEEIRITSATELEFWVRTPDDKADREQLSTSQELKEQYWKRTYGPVRTALEKSIEILDRYGFEMEMGHKEVGGVKSKLTSTGAISWSNWKLTGNTRTRCRPRITKNRSSTSCAMSSTSSAYRRLSWRNRCQVLPETASIHTWASARNSKTASL